jgi:23S rRNA (cytosine1962-C5)-methyltransferase
MFWHLLFLRRLFFTTRPLKHDGGWLKIWDSLVAGLWSFRAEYEVVKMNINTMNYPVPKSSYKGSRREQIEKSPSFGTLYPPLLAAVNDRLSNPDFKQANCLRVIHHESEDLRCDKLGSNLAFFWHGIAQPNKVHFQCMQRLTTHLQCQEFVLFPRFPKTTRPSWKQKQITWLGEEHGIIYEFRGDHGISPGLFLDQRQQRLWVQRNSAGKRVLNLFCYTGGFSVNAVQGGAEEVISVDSSSSALDWAKENISHNGLNTRRMKLWKDDVRLVLQRQMRRGERYDLIICDPPSFSCGKGKAFSLAKELPALLSGCAELLSPQGQLLFSCNLEGLSGNKLRRNLSDCAPTLKLLESFKNTEDFKSPNPYHLKSILLERSTN